MTHAPRIAIFYADAGAGHRRAAEAIAQPLIEHGATVALHDALRFTHPLFRAVYAGGGLGLITRLPRLYQLAYHISDQPSVDRVLRGPRYRTQQISTRALRRTIETFQPDAIVCTHYLAAELCAGWRHRGQLRVPVTTVITDFDPHFMWQHTGTDGYCAPTEAARDRLMHDGVDPAIITVTGIPIDPRFAALPDRVAAARQLQIDPDRPVVLIMGGGLGVGLMGSIGQALRAQPLEAQIVFITGQNHALRRKLKTMSRSWIVRGFVANMPDWLAVADVALSKAGGLSGSELLAAGVPTIIPCRLTGHETLNAHYLASTGAALLVATADEGVAEADRLLRDPQRRESMRSAALHAARPHAAALIADRLLNRAAVTPYALRPMWTLRRYLPTDREAVRQLAGDTAHFGDPIERFLDARDVFLDAFASFYTDVMCNYLWIAEEDGTLLGYIMGCPDTFDYNEWFRANVRKVAWRAATLRYRGTFTRKSMGYIWRYAHVHIPYVDLSPYPAHLHINTRADMRGSGIGTALMSTYLDQLRNENVPGVHLETSSENVIAVPWYERLGFQLLQRTPSDLYITSVGHSVDFLLYGMKL